MIYNSNELAPSWLANCHIFEVAISLRAVTHESTGRYQLFPTRWVLDAARDMRLSTVQAVVDS